MSSADVASAGVGIVQAGIGAYQAAKAAKRQKRALRNAYTTADARMVQDQGYTRQGESESLNARGLVSGGVASPISSAPIPPAAQAGGAGGGGLSGFGSRIAAAMAAPDPKAAQSARGEIGPANTLAGQSSRDLSKQFLLERQDLRNQRNSGLAGINQQESAAMSGAITGGIGSGISLYNSIAGMQNAQQTMKPSGSGIQGSFGVDVVDPLHNYDPTNSNFNFNVQRTVG